MERQIVAFGYDVEGVPIAILQCGHPQHVRHDPPFVNRPWVLTEAGRASKLGQTLNCVRCDHFEPPNPVFVAAGLLERANAVSTQAIYNYRQVDDNLILGGQPNEAQLRDAAAEGVTTVINLATINPRYSLPDEAGLVESLGMTYHHIPVEWENPTASDFKQFETLMQQTKGKTLVHCAANFRVTAFFTLYAMRHLGWTEAQADAFRASIWQGSDYPIWEKFVADMKADCTDDDDQNS